MEEEFELSRFTPQDWGLKEEYFERLGDLKESILMHILEDHLGLEITETTLDRLSQSSTLDDPNMHFVESWSIGEDAELDPSGLFTHLVTFDIELDEERVPTLVVESDYEIASSFNLINNRYKLF